MRGHSTGFDWLNISGIKSDTNLPPPPVSFGVSPTSSNNGSSTELNQTSSLNDLSTTANIEPVEEYEDLVAPLSLTANQLTPEESKTYLQWYNDMVVRKGTTVIKVADVFKFLRNNFKLPHTTILLLEKIFKDIVNLEKGGFFALLRLISHVFLLGQVPRRRLTNIPAPILKPKSILARRKRIQEDEQEIDSSSDATAGSNSKSSKIDLDSFTKFMLTGQRPSSAASDRSRKKSKRVKFSDEVPGETTAPDTKGEPKSMDLSLPMDQLLQQASNKHTAVHLVPQIQVTEDEEELKEMKDSLNHFQNIRNVDSALIHGTPSQIPSIFFDEVNNTTSNLSPIPTGQQTTPSLLAPNHTGPMPSLFNAYSAEETLSPNYTGNDDSYSSDQQQPLKPVMTGSLSGGLRQQFHVGAPALEHQHMIQNSLHLGANFNGSRTPSPLVHPPPPPPSRRMRSSSSPSAMIQNPAAPPPPPPPAARNYGTPPPALPPKTTNNYTNQLQQFSTFAPGQQQHHQPLSPVPTHTSPQQHHYVSPTEFYQTMTEGGLSNATTSDILGDLKSLHDEVERIRGFSR